MHTTHYLLGKSDDSACGRMSLWHAGLSGTRNPLRVGCLRCRKSPIYEAARREFIAENGGEVTPRHLREAFGLPPLDPPMTVTVDLQDNPTLVGWVMNDE